MELLDEISACLYCTLCRKLLAALISCIIATCINSQTSWIEVMNHQQPTSSMVLLLVLLPDSQFLCWSYSEMVASTCRKRWQKCSIFPWHLGVSYIMSCMCPAEHMMCCQCAAHHIDCTGLLQWTHDSCVVHAFVLFVSYSVAWILSHILIMDLLHVLQVHSLMLAPQCYSSSIF